MDGAAGSEPLVGCRDARGRRCSDLPPPSPPRPRREVGPRVAEAQPSWVLALLAPPDGRRGTRGKAVDPLADHQVWALGAILVAIGALVAIAVQARTPEWRADTRTWVDAAVPRWVLPIVVLCLLWDAWLLLQMVFRTRPPESA
jgi:hypothetical protein